MTIVFILWKTTGVPRSTATLLAAIALLLAAVCALALTPAGGAAAPANGPLRVVAAENVYGQIAAEIGGRRVRVVSLLANPLADPHVYQPGTEAALAVGRAAVVIENGAGYDPFMPRLESAAPAARRVTVTVAAALGIAAPGANPHLWYDVPRLDAIGAAIAAGLSRADPGAAAAYARGLRRFEQTLRPLRRELAVIRRRHAGAMVAATEPVADYLLRAAGLRVVTPRVFARAIEDGIDPPAQAMQQMLALVGGRRLAVLVYNDQAVSPLTARIRAAALAAGVPVVAVSETMPPGRSFAGWQLAQERALEAALDR